MSKSFLYSFYGFALSVSILFMVSLFSSREDKTAASGAPASLKIQSVFSSEEEYIAYINRYVKFDNLTLETVLIRKGDNFWKIARRHGVNIDTLIGANPHWDTLNAGLEQKILVPSRRGVLHFIAGFDEIDEVASLYDTDRGRVIVQELPLLYRLYYRFLGDRKPIAVFIPNAKPRTITMTERMAKQFAVREMFVSPLGGRYSSFFGGRIHPIYRVHSFHNGIDIATAYGTPVGASCSGVVTSSGWMGGYGNAVIITHANGFRTLYGHLSRICVRSGQHVKGGRLIGRAGSTGLSTGPHLHFTMWHNGKLVNPMNVLW